MKRLFFLILFLVFISCKKENLKTTPIITSTKVSGKELFENKGNCIACHQVEQKIIGPSLKDIGTIYKAKKASIVLFLKGEADPLVDPSQYEIMKTNFAITKTMTDEELKALEDYIFSFSK